LGGSGEALAETPYMVELGRMSKDYELLRRVVLTNELDEVVSTLFLFIRSD
jgi:hypothetical protein